MKIYAFDFDKTLCLTPEPEDSKAIWVEKMGKPWPYIGWWSKVDTLDTDVFDIKKNDWTYGEYMKAIDDDDSYVILATGRLDKVKGMRDAVMNVLKTHNLSFDEVHLNYGGDTLDFKKNLFESLIERINPDEFIIYDDRIEHIEEFYVWAKDMKCTVIINDVIRMVTKKIN